MDATVERLRRELVAGLAGLSAEETQMRPAVGKWSIQQVVEHLLLSYETTSAVVGVRVAKGTGTLAKPSASQWLGQMMITRLGYFPKGRKAPPAVAPAEVPERRMSGAELGERAAATLGTMDGVLVQAEGLFGDKRAISHLVLGPMNVRQWRRFHLVHGKHHLGQIAAIRGQMGKVASG